MTLSIVNKKSVLKQGTPMMAHTDGVVVINPGASAVFQIDTCIDDGQAVQFAGKLSGDDVSYGALYLLAKASYPSEYP